MSQPARGETQMKRLKLNTTTSLVLIAAAVTAACSSGQGGTKPGDTTPEGDGVFESADPSGAASRGGDPAAGMAGGVATDGASPENAAPPGANTNNGNSNEASREIAEADIIKVIDGKLYALSQYGGLAVIDISRKDELKLLGRHKVVATPFEMYVQDGIVFAMYQGYGEYVTNEADGTLSWANTSHVVILDATNPAAITQLDTFAVPGLISDSRVVGDVLYVASYEDGYCWGCEENAPKTTVISLDVSDPTNVSKVDQINFSERSDLYSWKRSLSATNERIYVAGPNWGNAGPVGSTIQVIDISDPAGDMVEGATVAVEGQINSRWQMDEYEGTLRVISQSFEWDTTSVPHIETFNIVSSTEILPLADVPMVLPRPEQLQSVRFDGDRGYAITFEQTDPLFTIDFSDPALPVQAGELEIPGWVYHMEPRGNRLIGLGFDQGNAAGSVHVSLFDVSDMTNPTLLSRANFGGDWGWLAEDQDRIHKAFNILDAANLILVPFSGYDQTNATECGGRYVSGVQLLDWENDTVTARGIAPSEAQARRGFLHEDRLFTVSDERVETFDITDRDAPATTAELPLTNNVGYTVAAGDKIVRIGQNWWTNTTEIDVTSLADATEPNLGVELALATSDVNACYGYEYLESVLTAGDRVLLVNRSYGYDPATGKEDQEMRVTTVDTSSGTPEVIGESAVDMAPGDYYYSYGVINNGAAQVAVGTTLASARLRVDYSQNTPRVTESSLLVHDFSDPNAVTSKAVALPAGIGVTGLVSSGSIVARSHFDASPSGNGVVRFYLDRVDVSDPQNPVVLPSLNIPGSLLAFDAEAGRALTVDYIKDVTQGTSIDDCYSRSNSYFESPDTTYDMNTRGTCTSVHYAINLVELTSTGARRLGREELDPSHRIGQVALGDDRAFITLSSGGGYYGYYGGVAVDCAGFCGGYSWFSSTTLPVLTVGGLKSGDFQVGTVEIEGGDYWGYSPIAAAGKRAVVAAGWRGKLTVLDAADAAKPSVLREAEISGYVQSLTVVGDTALAAMGLDGVQAIDLGD